MAEIKQLEEHFNLDLLILVDQLIALLSTTKCLEKMLQGQQLSATFVKDCVIKLSSGYKDEVKSVLALQILRCGDSDK